MVVSFVVLLENLHVLTLVATICYSFFSRLKNPQFAGKRQLTTKVMKERVAM
jgi:hypothetical protein